MALTTLLTQSAKPSRSSGWLLITLSIPLWVSLGVGTIAVQVLVHYHGLIAIVIPPLAALEVAFLVLWNRRWLPALFALRDQGGEAAAFRRARLWHLLALLPYCAAFVLLALRN